MSAKSMHLVSVIVTNYNYAGYIAETIESILKQTYKNLEIIIIDDGSTDNSVEVIESYRSKHNNITFLRQENQGVVFTRNRAIRESNGDFILFIDSDDKIPTTYIQKLVAGAQAKGLDVAYCDYKRFGYEDYERKFPEFDIELIKAENIVHMSSLIRKNAIKGHWFDENLNRTTHEDWDFFLGLALDGRKFGRISDTALLYRSHGQSRSGDIKSSAELNKQGFSLFKTYMYIVEKYKKIYPGKIDVTEMSEIIGWWRTSQERLASIRDYQFIVAKKEQRVSELEASIRNIEESRSYQLSQKISRISGFLRKMFEGNK